MSEIIKVSDFFFVLSSVFSDYVRRKVSIDSFYLQTNQGFKPSRLFELMLDAVSAVFVPARAQKRACFSDSSWHDPLSKFFLRCVKADF